MNETNTSSGLTQQIQNLTIDDSDLRFRVSAQTTLFYPDKKNLYKVVVLDHQSNKTQIRYVDRGQTLTNGYVVDQFGHTLSLVVNCQQVRKFPVLLQPALTS